MHAPAESFLQLLESEREAALAADTERLVALQDEKRSALNALKQVGLLASEVDTLSQKAAANIALLQHLAACLRSVVGESPPQTYSAMGQHSHRTAFAERSHLGQL
ncbi:MAG: hypothetical protein ACPGUV_11590 [Polyangiales bacterium]